MPTQAGFSYGAGALTNAKSVITLEQSDTEEQSADFPSKGKLGFVEIQLDTIAGGAGSVTWNLAWDSNGDHAVHPELSQDITTAKTTAAEGSVGASIDRVPFKRPVDGTKKKLYLVAALDVGTANARARVHWEK